MPRHVPHLDRRSQRVEPVALCNPQINLNGLEIHSLTHEALHDLWRFDQGTIVTMSPNFSTGFTHHVRSALRVIPMSMRQPEFNEPAFLAGENRLNVSPHLPRRID